MQVKFVGCSRGLGSAKTVDHGFNGVRFFSSTNSRPASLSFNLRPILLRDSIPSPDSRTLSPTDLISRPSPDLNPAQVACPVRKHPSPQPEPCAQHHHQSDQGRQGTSRPPS